MTVRDIISQVESVAGRQPEKYIMRLINDGLNEISSKKQSYTASLTTDLEVKKRWYELSDRVIDFTRVEIKDTDGRYVVIPKLVDSDRLIKELESQVKTDSLLLLKKSEQIELLKDRDKANEKMIRLVKPKLWEHRYLWFAVGIYLGKLL